MQSTKFQINEQDYLLSVAREAIEHHLAGEKYRPVLPLEFQQLKEKAATFVTLNNSSGSLRGCIGTLEAREALYLSIASNAVSAAFRDPRFPDVTYAEWQSLTLSISVLTKAVPLIVLSEQDLKQQLRVGIDGLILKEKSYSATFLPSVWDSLADKDDFIRQLKLKAGLSADYWSESIQFSTYQTLSFSGKAVLA